MAKITFRDGEDNKLSKNRIRKALATTKRTLISTRSNTYEYNYHISGYIDDFYTSITIWKMGAEPDYQINYRDAKLHIDYGDNLDEALKCFFTLLRTYSRSDTVDIIGPVRVIVS